MLHQITDALVAFGPVGVFLIAVMDSAGIPLPAALDVLVMLVAVKSPDRAWLMATMATAGSLAGNLALFLAARSGGRRWVKMPAPDKPQKFRRWFQRYGLFTVFIPAVVPMIPLPLKVFVVSAGVLHTGLVQFVAVIVLARVVRYFGEAWLGMKLGQAGAMAFLKGNAWTMAVVTAAVAVAIYVLIRLTERRREAA
ncbi:MAG TPA: VTT domain-containing protein [Candidatus Sulfopaludibacter sp.]|nr:VTT domain-containing protein [Candidatus Sulfopaludibacter sp.]